MSSYTITATATITIAMHNRSSTPGFEIEERGRYAELWMGTHPSAPSVCSESNKLLSEWLKEHPSAAGRVPDGYEEGDLAFLFKVLSVDTALSIQAHPNKSLAVQLHARDPAHYKDANHKPEMLVALTPFECLCGFQILDDIIGNASSFPEFGAVLSAADPGILKRYSKETCASVASGESFLKALFSAYMHCPDDVAKEQLQLMVSRLERKVSGTSGVSSSSAEEIDMLLLRLHAQYPGDNGVFGPLMFNYLKLQEGDSFFLGANVPHAYLSGDCVECMALSDNVVRAGLTPKFKDIDTLCSMLQYSSGLPEFLRPIESDAYCKIYRPPADVCSEFEVEQVTIPLLSASTTTATSASSSSGTYNITPVPCGSILLLAKGSSAVLTVMDSSSASSSSVAVMASSGKVGTAADGTISCTLSGDPEMDGPLVGGTSSVPLAASDGNSSAHTMAVNLGSVLFIPANAHVSIRCDYVAADDKSADGSNADVVFYRAHVNLG